MGLIVQKYGGSSLADKERIINVARRIVETKREGNKVIAIVSAKGNIRGSSKKRNGQTLIYW